MDQQPSPSDRSRTVGAIALIGIGALFLIVQIFKINVGAIFWPFFIIVPGAMMLGAAFSRTPANTGLAVPGAIVTATGLFFLYQSATGNWESWAYIWTLYPAAAGVALIAAGTRNDDPDTVKSGRDALRWGLIAFVIGAIFFELLIFNRGGVAGWILPILLILGGAYLLWRQNSGGASWNPADRFGFGRPNPPPPAAPYTPPTPPPSPPPPYGGSPTPPPVPPVSPPPSSAPPMPRPSTARPAPAPARPAPPPRPAPAPPPVIAMPPPEPEPMPEPPPPSQPFPEDDLPEPPEPDGAPFPADDTTTEPPAATAKPRSTRPAKPAEPEEGGQT